MDKKHFISIYGPWAIIAGATEGIGEAFAQNLAGIGFNLVLIARREALLKEEAQKLQDKYGICVRTINFDLSETEKLPGIDKMTADLDIGLFVYNAALSLVGPFMDNSEEDHLKEIDVNIKGPLVLTMLFGERFIKRERGGIILMSSLTSSQGSPLVANYGATKAWNLILAEGLWYEMKEQGVDIMACAAGATNTPGYRQSLPGVNLRAMDPGSVAKTALANLGRKPVVIPGIFNNISGFILRRLLPIKTAVCIMGFALKKMYGKKEN
ncbi:MAG: SDR family NAD(P)-dependent oxidoreductase [Brevinematales bacterium]